MSAVHHSGALPREPDPDHGGLPGVPLTGIRIDDTPAIGRAPEFDRIVARLLATRPHQTGMVALSGEAGIGKTLLMQKVSERAQEERFLVVWERMLEGDWQPPYHAWAGILHQAMTDLAWPTTSDEPPDWAQTLLPILPHLSHLYPHLAPVANLSLQEERFRLPDAIVRCLCDLSQHCPLLIVLDDIQWSDPGSLRVLLHLGRSTRPAALMVLIAYRDDYVDGASSPIDVLNQIRREASFEEIALRGLPIEDIERLMHNFGAETMSPNLVRLVSEATQGNPFFVHEITRHLIESQDLQAVTSVPGSLDGDALSIPESLRQVVDHRLGRLSATAQRMLRLAAVCTDGFDFQMLRALTSLDEGELLDAIDEAMAARLITPIGNDVERYDFQHSLVRRALYDGWSPSRRIRLHRALATSLEQVHHDAHHLYAPALAVHYHISANVPGAEAGVPYALAAARGAARRSAPEQ
ncbi:MAG: AAA family ATPase, partial [Chloroflexota bacterium]|nr:AAA family ATPase [Chloroflexota bacterium]